MKIEVIDLCKRYEARGRVITALGGISLSFAPGSLVAIVGQSGSGKTTLLNHLCGMDRPDGGRILLDGRDITTLSQDELARERRSRIGVIYQFYNLIPELSVRDNVTLPAELRGETVDEARLREILATVGLSGREEDMPAALSGGQQQRAAIARALYQEPQLLLADEPTGNLDEENSRQILSLLCALSRERGMTVIMVTHSAAVAAAADRVITLREGQVVNDERR